MPVKLWKKGTGAASEIQRSDKWEERARTLTQIGRTIPDVELLRNLNVEVSASPSTSLHYFQILRAGTRVPFGKNIAVLVNLGVL